MVKKQEVARYGEEGVYGATDAIGVLRIWDVQRNPVSRPLLHVEARKAEKPTYMARWNGQLSADAAFDEMVAVAGTENLTFDGPSDRRVVLTDPTIGQVFIEPDNVIISTRNPTILTTFARTLFDKSHPELQNSAAALDAFQRASTVFQPQA